MPSSEGGWLRAFAVHIPDLRKLSWTLFLPVFLLFAQQGELRHAYAHDGQAAARCRRDGQTASNCLQAAPSQTDHCPLCLAFAHLSSAVETAVVPHVPLSDLAFGHPQVVAIAKAKRGPLAPRNRGPPIPWVRFDALGRRHVAARREHLCRIEGL